MDDQMNNAQLAKLNAEIAKLNAETMKILGESRWYPYVVVGGIFTAALALAKFLH